MKKVNIGFTNRLFAEGLELMIKGFEGYDVQHSIPNEKLLNYTSLNPGDPEILILELDIPRKSDIAFIQALLETFPGINILLITSSPSPNISAVLIESGISAYLLKSCIPTDLQSALNKINTGKNYFCSTITGALLTKKGDRCKSETLDLLTLREKEVLVMLVNNNSTNRVAEKLNISENTVKTHKRNIQTKLGINSPIGMMLYAVRNSLVEMGYHDLCLACPYFSNN